METVVHLREHYTLCQHRLHHVNGLWLKGYLALPRSNRRMRKTLLNELNHAAWHHLIFQLLQARWQRIHRIPRIVNGINTFPTSKKCTKILEGRHLFPHFKCPVRKRKKLNLVKWRGKCQDLHSPRTAKRLNAVSQIMIKSIMSCFWKSLEILARSLQIVLWNSGGVNLGVEKLLVLKTALWAATCNLLLEIQSVITKWSQDISAFLKKKEQKLMQSCNSSLVSLWHRSSMPKIWENHLHD